MGAKLICSLTKGFNCGEGRQANQCRQTSKAMRVKRGLRFLVSLRRQPIQLLELLTVEMEGPEVVVSKCQSAIPKLAERI